MVRLAAAKTALKLSPQRIVKAARTLLSWSQATLAEESGLALSSVARFEAGAGLSESSMEKVLSAFAEHGLEFIVDDGDVVGFRFGLED